MPWFTRKTWKDYPDLSTPLNATGLNDLEDRRLGPYTPLFSSNVCTIPFIDTLNGVSLSNGAVLAVKALVRATGTYTNIRCLANANTGMTDIRLFVADNAGNVLTQSANLVGATWTNVVNVPLLVPQNLNAGDGVYLGVAGSGGTTFGINCRPNAMNSTLNNGGVGVLGLGGAFIRSQATSFFSGGTVPSPLPTDSTSGNQTNIPWIELL